MGAIDVRIGDSGEEREGRRALRAPVSGEDRRANAAIDEMILHAACKGIPWRGRTSARRITFGSLAIAVAAIGITGLVADASDPRDTHELGRARSSFELEAPP